MSFTKFEFPLSNFSHSFYSFPFKLIVRRSEILISMFALRKMWLLYLAFGRINICNPSNLCQVLMFFFIFIKSDYLSLISVKNSTKTYSNFDHICQKVIIHCKVQNNSKSHSKPKKKQIRNCH